MHVYTDVVFELSLSVIGCHSHFHRTVGEVDAVARVFCEIDSCVALGYKSLVSNLNGTCSYRIHVYHKFSDIGALWQRVGVVDLGIDKVNGEKHRVECPEHTVVL